MQPKYVGYIFPATSGAQLSEDASEWFTGFWDKVIPVIEKRLAEGGQRYIAGNKLSIADIKAFQTVSTSPLCNPHSPVPASVKAQLEQKVRAAPHYAAWVEQMKTDFASYLAARPPRPL